jgi:hypothetical protein
MNIKWGMDKVRIDVCWRCPCSRYCVIGSRDWSLLLRSRYDFLKPVSKNSVDVVGRRYQAYVRRWFCTVVSNDYVGDHQLRTLTGVYDQDVGWLAISVSLFPYFLTHEGPISKIISLYTLRVVCFWRVDDSDKETEFTGENVHDSVPVRRRCLIHSLIVVACLWCSLGLLVTINVLIDGVQQFYGPTGYCGFMPAS